MKKEIPTICERSLQFRHPKKYCRSKRSSAGGAENRFKRRENTIAVDYCAFCKEPYRTEDKNTCGEYKKEASIQNKMRIEKCDAYKAKEILGYRGGKSYVSAAKREENQRGTTVETIPQSKDPNEEKGRIHGRTKQSK